METCKDIKVNGYGAVASANEDALEQYYLVRWTGLPFTLQEETALWGYDEPAGAGAEVCEAIVQERLHSCPGWWQTPQSHPGKSIKVRLSVVFVIKGNVIVEHAQANGLMPPRKRGIEFNLHNLKIVDGIQVDEILKGGN